MAELDQALCNRDALAAIAVFRSQEQAPTSVPFQHNDDKAIVVLDPDDERRVRAASRLHVGALDGAQGARGRRGGRVRPRAGHGLLDDACRSLERHTAIKRFHTQARKSIDQAADQVRDLIGEVHESLDSLDTELRA